jgi:hypothetical protein
MFFRSTTIRVGDPAQLTRPDSLGMLVFLPTATLRSLTKFEYRTCDGYGTPECQLPRVENARALASPSKLTRWRKISRS